MAQADEQTDAQIAETINKMTHRAMATLWRNAPSGHPYFDSTKPHYVVFKARYDAFGGMTPELSKSIGWD